jgi:hypothetical protein
VAILAAADDRFLNATNGGANGTVVAVVSGVQHPTKGYHFTPNALFVFVVYNGSGSTGTWDLFMIPNGSNSHARVDSGVFKECTPGKIVYWIESAATFAECGDVHHASTSSLVRRAPIATAGLGSIDLSFLRSVSSFMSAPYNGETSGWLTCDSGCCTMED